MPREAPVSAFDSRSPDPTKSSFAIATLAKLGASSSRMAWITPDGPIRPDSRYGTLAHLVGAAPRLLDPLRHPGRIKSAGGVSQESRLDSRDTSIIGCVGEA